MDYRFSLANERTFLAYLRTSLALDAAGLAVAHLLDVRPSWLADGLGVLLALAGLWVGVAAIARYRQVAAAMESGEPLPAARLPIAAAVAIAITSVAAVVLAVL